MPGRVIRCVLSGSYHKDTPGLLEAYDELVTTGCQVISPHRLDFTSDKDLFVKDRAEADLSAEMIEKHHLLAISQADFVWLHAPEGYIGTSACFEIGYAAAKNVPVYSTNEPSEPIFLPFVTTVQSVYKAVVALN